MTTFDLHTYLKRSTNASGVPLRITNPPTISAISRLLVPPLP